MDWQGILIFVHILLLVFWLGTDIGVFVLGKFAQNPAYQVEQRLLLLKVGLILDMFPRVCMVLMIPTGYQMAVNLGAIDPGQYVSEGVWGFSIIWLAVVLTGMARQDQPVGVTAKRIEKMILYILLVLLVWAGLASLINGAPIATPWLAAKIMMYAMIIISVLLLEKVFFPAVAGFARLEQEGSSPELEQQIRGGMDKTYVWVLAIYAMVVVSAYFGVLKPDL